MNALTRFLSAAALLLAALTTLSLATEIPPGPVTGHWYATGNPYNINGEIYVPAYDALYIHEGVHVVFQGYYELSIGQNAILLAIGTEEDSISFDGHESQAWNGLSFSYSSDSCRLSYCILKDGLNQVYPLGGGAIFADHTNLTVTNSLIKNSISVEGGGIYFDSCSTPLIQSNIFDNNQASLQGGGIYYYQSGGVVKSNIFSFNNGGTSTTPNGGAIFLNESAVAIMNNVFYQNYSHSGQGAAIHAYDHSNAEMINNLFYQNYGSAINISYYSSGILLNNTICFNIGSGGSLLELAYSMCSGFNNIIWGSGSSSIQVSSGAACYLNHSDIQGGFAGIGNINQDPLFVAGPDGGYYLSQIAAGQTQQSPCVDAGNISIISGTTRTDQVPDQGITDMGYHYTANNPIPPQTITLTPSNPPVLIPQGGGSFDFDVTIANTYSGSVDLDVWINICVPGGVQFTILGPVSFVLPGGSTIIRTRTIGVPASAPSGEYICLGTIGDYPWRVVDTDQFTFTKLGANDRWSGEYGWLCTGSPFPGEENGGGRTPALQLASGSGATPTTVISPNPFNPSTDIRYQMPDARYVSLRVYDTAGRLVVTLVDGWREAGEHRATFDGSGLAAGVYVYRLEASGSGPEGGLRSASPTMTSGKMVLLK